jgi:hypothetical protein
VLVAGGFLVVNGYEGVADEERGFTARSMVWSASSSASCGEVEGRLEVVSGIGALWAMKMASF